jgi:hypothetical protein
MGAVRTAKGRPVARCQGMAVVQYVFTRTMNLDFLEPKDSAYLLKNHLLCVPAEWMIQEDVSKSIEETKPVCKKFMDDVEFRNDAQPVDFPVLDHVTKHFDGVYSMPLFSDTFCKVVLDEINHIKQTNGFKVNEGEEKEVQIEEFVLADKSPGWYYSMWQIIAGKINVVFAALFQRIVTDGVIQLANYNPKEITQTTWHHDGDADITMVVPLNTGGYEGGGTEFWNTGVVDPLPNGHALIFPTYGCLHRGLPLKSGDRYLFVFWLKQSVKSDKDLEEVTKDD